MIKKIVKQIKKANKIVLFHHVNPDGDTLSSSYGLMRALQLRFPNKEIKWFADKERIRSQFSYIVENFNDTIDKVDESWTAIIGDNAVEDRIYGSEEFLKAGFKICFDHHTNIINFKHDLYWREPTLGASSVQAYYIAKALKVNFDSKTAISMLFGILTDTFNFVYSLNDTRPMEAATELMKFIERDELDNMYKQLRKRTQDDIAFQAFALSNYKVDDKVAFLKIKDSDLKKLKINVDQAARVNLIGNIEGIEIWMFMIEDKENKQIKISLRSLGAPVNEIANKFNGGGHIRASGIKITNDWKVADEVIKESKKQLKSYLQK